MPGLPVHHQLPEFTQTHVHWVGDAIQLSHPLSSPSPPAFTLSQHQGLFQWVSSSHQVAKVLESDIICVSEVVDISPGSLGSSLWLIQPRFCMIYSAQKLNKQDDNIQPCHTPFPIWNHSIVPCKILIVASWPAYRFLKRQVRWSYSHLFKNFPVSCDPYSHRLSHSQWSWNRCFSGIPLLSLWSNKCWQFHLWFLCLLI